MKENKKEIEKMQINLIDMENNINTFELERTNEGDVIYWKYTDDFYQLEIKTDDEIKNAEIISKSQNLEESSDIIIQKHAKKIILKVCLHDAFNKHSCSLIL